MKVFITKYALTVGIFQVDAEIHGGSSNMISCKRGGAFSTEFFHGKDWHCTAEKAVERAEEMRAAKIKSLEKQITKLKGMTFKVKS